MNEGENPRDRGSLTSSRGRKGQALDEGEDLVAQPSLQGTFLHSFLTDYRRITFSNLLLDSNH
jgi:hypothetical protein